ncbi:FAD binding domain-containing protein [Bisporella sp. PMI_857]|nr:FAD binding domain-containing protein [Bisporella sp. PMI_857]
MHFIAFTVLSTLLSRAICVNFAYEAIQLSDEDTAAFPAIAFGETPRLLSSPNVTNPANCRAFPGTPQWPIDEEWQQLNRSLGGALLKPQSLAAVCYSGPTFDSAKCTALQSDASSSRFYLDDPLTVLTAWPQGDTCPLPAQGNCTQGGSPEYVVNVTTVRQIQIAVNFARNKNIRLVIKNTGHEFNGRSTGAGSLSIWTHHLKSFEFLPEYSQGPYDAPAARVGAGLEGWELFQYMDKYNITVAVPMGNTVGAYGGWITGGGHAIVSSIHGLGSDQPLKLQVVTADGRFITADPDTNEDLYYALRGGGPGNYGIITSAIVKAHPQVNVTESTLTFTSGADLEVFWQGVNEFFYFGKEVADLGGTAYNYVIPNGNNRYSFRNVFQMTGMSNARIVEVLKPLFDTLNASSLNPVLTNPVPSINWSDQRKGLGDIPGNSRFGSRLYPRSNWDSRYSAKFNATMDSLRAVVEAGYTFHGIHMSPNEKVAGWPGVNSGVNPAFRKTIMHADIFDYVTIRGMSAQEQSESHDRLNFYMNKIRAATPGAGAYVNEADLLEPDYQKSFWGDKYQRLLRIKRRRDPWDLFWAQSTVGSEGWAVRTEDGRPNQNGPLCRV